MKSIHKNKIRNTGGALMAFICLAMAKASLGQTATESPLLNHSGAGNDRPTLEWGVQNCVETGDGSTAPFFEDCEFVVRKETGADFFENYLKVLDMGPGQGARLIINEESPVGPTIIDMGGISTDQVISTGMTSINSFAGFVEGDVIGGGIVDVDFIETTTFETEWFDLLGAGGSNINMNPGTGGGAQIRISMGSNETFIDANGITSTGVIEADEIKTETWRIATPDYVFEPDYNLKPLQEVEKFVTENRHLPDIPSGKKMEAEGIELATMSMRLLKKVEELTLYAINADKVIKAQDKNIAEQKAQLNELQILVNTLLKEGEK